MRTAAIVIGVILAIAAMIIGFSYVQPFLSMIWNIMDVPSGLLCLGATVFGVWRLILSATYIRSYVNAAGRTVRERELIEDEDGNPIGPTITGLREWLGAYNVLHVYVLYLMANEVYLALNLDNNSYPNYDKFVVCLFGLTTYALVGYFGRWRDNALVAGQPWSLIALVQGMFLAFFFFVPFVDVNPENLGWAADSWQMGFLNKIPFGWWAISNTSLRGQFLLLGVSVWALYIFGVQFFDRGLRYASFYWGSRCAFGAIVLWWGIRASEKTRELIVENDSWLVQKIGGEELASLSSMLWIGVTIVAIIGIIGWRIARDMSNSDKDWWFAAVSVPGVFKAFGSGGNLTHFVMNVSGVPMAIVDLPVFPGLWWMITRNYEAIWQWMLIDLQRRGNPRYFGRGTMWVGPGFCYPGIPFYTKVMELVQEMWEMFLKDPVIERLGSRKYGTLLPVGDFDIEKGPHSTGRIGLEVMVDFRWRLINPFAMWTHNSWKAQIDNAVDRLTAGLVRIMRFGLFGESGPIAALANYRAEIPADDNHPAIPERLANAAVTAEDQTFVRSVGEQTGGLVDERELQAVTTSDEAVQEFLAGDVSTHQMASRMARVGMDDDEVQELVKRVTIARSLKGIDGGALALVGLGGLFGAAAGGGAPPAGGGAPPRVRRPRPGGGGGTP